MRKIFCLLTLLSAFSALFAAEPEILPSNTIYDLTEMGYIDAPQMTSVGMIMTNNRQSEIYLLEKGKLTTLVSSPGCGRYTNLNADKTLLGFKSINAQGQQAPAVLDLASRKVSLLQPYSDQCGQVSFSAEGAVAYTMGDMLIVEQNGKSRQYELGCYSNIANISPDGRFVAYSNHDGQPILLDLMTQSKVRLSANVELYNPRWSADSRKVLYEQSNMTLYAYDISTKQEYPLGKGFGAQWLNDEEIVYSRSEYQNGDIFFCTGISICRASFDGKKTSVIIPSSPEYPQEVAVLENNRLAIAYSYGDRRLVSIDIDNSSVETPLYTLSSESAFGYVHPEPDLSAVAHISEATAMTGTLDWTDIPYINQCYDTPPYNGSYAYGPCACAPSTSCMVLAFYGCLTPVSTASRSSWASTNNYGTYVGLVYTHPKTGYTFNLTHMSSCGGAAAGGYGFMWNGGSPSSKMGMFYQNNGVGSTYDYNGLTTIRTETASDYPFSWCITSSRTDGHVILPYRADAAYVKSGSTYVYQSKTGSVVVQDPYGNANNATWKSDGRHATYDCSGYNNGYLVMVNAWGVKVHLSRTPCSIEYELNGGHFTEEVSNTFYTDFKLPTPVKDGAAFMGWYADETYSGSRLTTVVPNSGVSKVYALWSDMKLVRYALNGGNFPAGVTPPTIVKEMYVLPTPYRVGFDFVGWLWQHDLLGDPVTILQVGDAGTLFAQWTRSVGLDDIDLPLTYVNHVVLNPSHVRVNIYSANAVLLQSSTDDISLEEFPAGVYFAQTPNGVMKIFR